MRYLLIAIFISINIHSAVITLLSNKENAMLEVIAYAEGTYNEYNIMYSYKYFESYNDHPRVINCANGICSSAAGRYQFLSSTWDRVAGILGLDSFSPRNQDIAALTLIQMKGVDCDKIKDYSDFNRAIYKLNKTWASFPGAPYGQPVKKMKDLYKVWRKYER
jgi:muramidase (phage lysozyme)